MPENQNIPNERREDEKSNPQQEEVNKNIFPLQSVELAEPQILNVTPDIEKKSTYYRHMPRHQNNSVLLVYLLWILGTLCLGVYIFIDVRLIYIDHRLTRFLPPIQERGIFYFISRSTHLLTYTFLAFSVIWILFKAQKNRAVLYFILFIELLVLLGIAEQLYILEIFNRYPDFSTTLIAVFGIFLIKFSQEFPLHLNQQHVVHALAHRQFGRRLIKPLTWLLKLQNLLSFFIPLFFVVLWLVPSINFIIRGWIITAIMLIAGLYYTFIQINCGSRKQLQPLYWWLWAMLINFLYYLYIIINQLFQLGLPDEIWRILFTVALISIIICCLMAVYFTDLLDAGLVLRKTFLYASLILILLAFFGSMEHYLFHHLAHWLHLKNTVITSIFSAITGMLFHPLKEKLTHWIKHFEKREMMVEAE
jgi:hypothetical protein